MSDTDTTKETRGKRKRREIADEPGSPPHMEQSEDEIAEPVAKKRKRDPNWELQDTVDLIRQVHRVGAGRWEQILKWFHDRHRLTHIQSSEASKLGKHFNYVLAGKGALYATSLPKLVIKDKKKYTEEELLNMERSHVEKENQARELREQGLLLLKQIRDRQILPVNTDETVTEQQIVQQQTETRDARQDVRETKVQQAISLANSDIEFRTQLSGNLAKLITLVESAVARENAYMDLLIAEKRAALEKKPVSE